MIIGIHHAQLTIPKGLEQDARRFYCGVLELTEVQKPKSLEGRGGLWLQVGALQVHIGAQDDIDRKKSKSHVAYEVSDIAQWKKTLHEQGIETVDGIPIPHCERFEFRDPFGNRVEFIERKP